MEEFNLGKYDSSVYLEDFDSEELEIVPFREGGVHLYKNSIWLRREESGLEFSREQLDQLANEGISRINQGPKPAHAYCNVGPEDRRFRVNLVTHNDRVVPEIVNVARDALSQIVELDNKARKIGNTAEDNPQLDNIVVNDTEVGLHYFSTTVNSEWTIEFCKAEDGSWKYSQIY